MSVYKGSKLVLGTNNNVANIMGAVNENTNKTNKMLDGLEDFLKNPTIYSFNLATIVVTCKSSSFVGKSVIVTGDHDYSETKVFDDKLFLVFPVGKLGNYTVESGGNVHHVYFDVHKTIEIIADYSIDTWEGINRIVKAGLAQEYFEVGDEIVAKVQGLGDFPFQVGGFNINGPNQMTLVAKYALPAQHRMFQSNIFPSESGYAESEVKHFLESDFFNWLPKELQAAIIPKKTQRQLARKANVEQLETFTDIIWLPTGAEIGFQKYDNNQQEIDAAEVIPIFVDNNSRIKLTFDTKVNITWWLSSVRNLSNSTSNYSAYQLLCTTNSGTQSTFNVADLANLVPCFVIGEPLEETLSTGEVVS